MCSLAGPARGGRQNTWGWDWLGEPGEILVKRPVMCATVKRARAQYCVITCLS